MCVCVQSDPLQSRGLKPNRLLCPWNFPSKNAGMGCHFLLQQNFLQALNLHLLYWKADSLSLCHLGSPVRDKWKFYINSFEGCPSREDDKTLKSGF